MQEVADELAINHPIIDAGKLQLEARFSYVPLRLPFVFSHRLGDNPRRTQIVDRASYFDR
jgi:hypothetical protein